MPMSLVPEVEERNSDAESVNRAEALSCPRISEQFERPVKLELFTAVLIKYTAPGSVIVTIVL
jgi:hypothetical protein